MYGFPALIGTELAVPVAAGSVDASADSRSRSPARKSCLIRLKRTSRRLTGFDPLRLLLCFDSVAFS